MSIGEISRRGFVAGGMAALSSLVLPCIEGDVFSLVPAGARVAHADEGDSDSARIMVVSRTQIGVVVYDVSNPKSLKPVSNATVKIVSRFNQGEVSGQVDASGKIIFDIAQLSDGSNAEIPSFNGRIEVSCEGYRDVVIPLTRVVAHSAIVAPTRPLDDKPYFRSLSMNEWDIQYTQQTFMYSKESSDAQVIEGELILPGEGATPKAWLSFIKDGWETRHGFFEVVEQNGKVAKLRIEGQYLLEGGNDCFADVSQILVYFTASGMKSEWWIRPSITVERAPFSENKEGKAISIPAVMGGGVNGIILPDSFVPPFAGAKLNLWQPKLPFLYDFSPLGYAMLGFGYSAVAAKKDNGSIFSSKGWQSVPRKSVEDQGQAEYERQMKSWETYKKLQAIRAGRREDGQQADPKKWAHDFSSFWSATFDAQVYGLAKYSFKDQLWNVSLNGLVGGRVDVVWTLSVSLGGFPLYLVINPWANIYAALKLAATTANVLDFEDYSADDTTFGAGASIGINITIGFGFNNLLSASVTGGGYISVFVNYAKNPGKPWPRLTAGYGFSAVAMLQASFIKMTFPIWSMDESNAYDSNDKHDSTDGVKLTANSLDVSMLDSVLQKRLGSCGMQGKLGNSLNQMPTFADILKYGQVVTNSQLRQSKEFSASAALESAQNPYSVEGDLVSDASEGASLPDIRIVPVQGVQENTAEVGEANAAAGETNAAEVGEANAESDETNAAEAGEANAAAQGQGTSVPQNESGAAESDDSKLDAGGSSSADSSNVKLIDDGSKADELGYLPTFTYVGSVNSATTTRPGIEGISDGNLGGVKPQVDQLMLKDVNSNPCMKLLVTENMGLTILFRIASVDVGNGSMRQRLVYHLLKNGAWSQPWVVNFDPQAKNISRSEMYDFEFDVTQAMGPGGDNYISVLLVSGTRPNGDNTAPAEGMKAKCVSLVTLYDSYAASDRLKAVASMTSCIHELAENSAYTLTTPSVTGFSDVFGYANTKDYCVMGTYVRHKFNEQEGLTDEGDTVAFFARWEADASTKQDVFTVTRQRIIQTGNGFISWPVKIDDDSYSWQWGSVANKRRATFATYDGNWGTIAKLQAEYENNDPSKFKGFGSFNIADFGGPKGMQVQCLYPWGSQGNMLGTFKAENSDGAQISALYHIAFDAKNSCTPTFTQVGPKEGVPADFVVDAGGHFLFYAQNTDGKVGQTYNSDGTVAEDVVEHRHCIMAIAQVDGVFTTPFVFAEVDHFVDDLVASTVNDSYVTFMASSVKDIDNSLADIYDVRVPLVTSLNPVKLICKEPFALSGEECAFQVDIRNDGNLVATAATFTLYDAEDGKQVGEPQRLTFADAQVSFTASAGEEGNYDTAGFSEQQQSSLLVANNGSGAVLPGQTVSVEVSCDIPDTWHDAKTVYVVISDVEVVNPTGTKPGLFSSFQLASAEDLPTENLEVGSVEADKDSSASGEVREVGKDNPASSDDGDSDHSGTGSNGNDADDDTDDASDSKKGMARTSDDLGMLAPAVAAVAVAGASMAAYSRRRTEIARGDFDDE